MAYFVKLNSLNEVTQIIRVNNEDILDENGNESEEVGKKYCENLFGGTWIQTSFNASFRKNTACIGDTYDPIRDAFLRPKPFSKFILNEETCCWEAPIEYPLDGKRYVWNDNKGEWEELVND